MFNYMTFWDTFVLSFDAVKRRLCNTFIFCQNAFWSPIVKQLQIVWETFASRSYYWENTRTRNFRPVARLDQRLLAIFHQLRSRGGGTGRMMYSTGAQMPDPGQIPF